MPRLAVCTLLALLAWLPSLWLAGSSFDDAEAVRGNPVVEGGAPLREAFLRDYWDHLSPAGHYRPVASLSLRLDHARWGPAQGAGWHASNVALHVLVVLLAGLLLLRLEPARELPWIGLALFAVHPVLADSVAWISGRSSMLSAAAGLAGALGIAHLLAARAALRPAALAGLLLCALVGVCLALLGKEDGIVFAALYALLAWRAPRRAGAAVITGCALGLAGYLLLRAQALGSPWPSAPHAPLADLPLLQRLRCAGRALWELLRLIAWPVDHAPSYERDARLLEARLLPALLGWLAWGAALFGGLARARRRPDSRAAWGLVLAAGALIPVLQWIPAGALFAPRFAYLPLLFAVPAVHVLARAAPARGRTVLVSLLLAAGVLGAWERSRVYASRESFQRAVLAQRPDDAPAWNELGLAREAAGDPMAARAAFERAAELDPGYSRPWSNLARLLLAAGDESAALAAFERAARLGPRNAVAQHNLGAVLLRLRRPTEALVAFDAALALAPRRADSQRARGRALLALGREDEARAALARALQLDPDDASARRLLDELAP